MSDLKDFLTPINTSQFKPLEGYYTSNIGASIDSYETAFPVLEGVNLALVGVMDDRNSVRNEGCAKAPDQIREEFYRLNKGAFDLKIADLGNVMAGATIRDTYIALKTILIELIKINVVPIIIGGGQDLTYAQYWAYEELGRKVDLVVIDSRFDLEAKEGTETMNSGSYLNNIILHEPNYLFNYSNIGYQTYFVNQESINLMQKLYFDIHRLGEFSNNIQESEPIVRNADLLSVDVSAIKQADAPANANASPNGFYGEDICQIMRYAGMSDKLTSVGLYEMNPNYDERGQTAKLLAQMIWCFIDGYYSRKNDLPEKSKKDFVKYRATFKDTQYEVVFYKSKKSDRWWMQIPYPNNKTKNERYHLVPCSYNDYQIACNGDMPDRWWKNFQKLI